jgi:uncharacterized protein with HEPN domain
MAKPPAKTQNAYLHDILESARLIQRYMDGISYDEFWDDSQKRDAVALRLAVIGGSARRISRSTRAALPNVPFKNLGGMRNRIAHDDGAVDFKIVWAVTQDDIAPLIASLASYLPRA